MADSSLLRRAVVAAMSLLAAGCVGLAIAAALTDAGDVEFRLALGWLAAGAAPLAAMQLAHIALWRRLLAALGMPLPARPARAIWSVSNLARYVPTGLMAPAARIALSAREGVPRSATLVASGYELAPLSTGRRGSPSARIMGSRWHLLTPHHHNFFFRRSDLRRLLSEAGLATVEAAAWPRWAIWPTSSAPSRRRAVAPSRRPAGPCGPSPAPSERAGSAIERYP